MLDYQLIFCEVSTESWKLFKKKKSQSAWCYGYHLSYEMQERILIEAGSNNTYLHSRWLLKWEDTIWEEKMCMPASSTNMITTGSSLLVLPRHIRNVFYFLFWPNHPFNTSSSTFPVVLIQLFFSLSAPAHRVPPSCADLPARLSLPICQSVSLAHSSLISYKCSVLPPMMFLFLKIPSKTNILAAALFQPP